MSYGLLGTLLLLLPGGVSAQAGSVQQNPGQLRVRPGDTVEMSCISSDYSNIQWYKEKPDGSLEWIYESSSYISLEGKYSGGKKSDQTHFFAISPAQQEDSGVYYCSSYGLSAVFGSGTRLVVSNATEPQLSILVPVGAEEPGQPPATFPLLCHLHDIPAGWDTVRWQPSGEVTSVMAAAVDEHGVLSAWSITWVSAERWDGAATCTAENSGTNRSINNTITIEHSQAHTGSCISWPLPLALSCVCLLLLLQLSILLYKWRLTRSDPPGTPLAAPSP